MNLLTDVTGPLLLAADAAEFTELGLSAATKLILASILGAYLLGLTCLSVAAARRVETEEDYLVAGRKLSLFLCWGSLIAAWFGAGSMTAMAENARDFGLMGVMLDPFASAATLIYAGVFFAGPLWRMKLLTTGDFFRRTYGPTAELVGVCLQIPAYFGWIAVQYTALAGMLSVYFGVPWSLGVLLTCLVTLFFTMIGGMWSVSLTDALQIVVAFTGLTILAYTAYARFGGGSALAGLDRLFAESDPAALSLLPAATTAAILQFGGVWITGVCGNIPSQDLHQRIFSARDAWTAAAACILSGVLYLLFGLIPVGLGLITRISEPGVKGEILQLMAGKYLSPTMAVIFLLTFTSMVVSTATSAVLAPATLLSHNLLGRLKAFQGRGLFLDRLCVSLISLGGLALAFSGQRKMELLELTLSLQLVALYVPLHLGLYGRPKSPWSAILAMACGTAVYVARWLPQNILFPPPADFAGDYGEWVGQLGFRGAGVVGLLLTVPEELCGLTASLLGYGAAQLVFARRLPINDQTRKDAWGDAASPTS